MWPSWHLVFVRSRVCAPHASWPHLPLGCPPGWAPLEDGLLLTLSEPWAAARWSMKASYPFALESSIQIQMWKLIQSPQPLFTVKWFVSRVKGILNATGKCKFQFLTFSILCDSFKGFPGSSAGKESTCNAGDPGSIPGSGRSPGEGKGCPLQYSCASLVAQLVKNPPAMWETWVWSLGLEDPGEGNGYTLIFWTGEFHGLYSPWGCKQSDTTEWWLASCDSFKNSNGNVIYATLDFN